MRQGTAASRTPQQTGTTSALLQISVLHAQAVHPARIANPAHSRTREEYSTADPPAATADSRGAASADSVAAATDSRGTAAADSVAAATDSRGTAATDSVAAAT